MLAESSFIPLVEEETENLLNELLEDINRFDNYVSCFLPSQPNEAPPKRKLKPRGRTAHGIRAPKPIVIPRILKADVRRKYGDMFSNVLNSGDTSLIYRFLERFQAGTIGLAMDKTNRPDYSGSYSLPTLEMMGTEIISYYFRYLFLSYPDHILRLSDIQIRQRSNSSKTQLIAKFQTSCTQLNHISPVAILSALFDESDAGKYIELAKGREDSGCCNRNGSFSSLSVSTKSSLVPSKISAGSSIYTFDEDWNNSRSYSEGSTTSSVSVTQSDSSSQSSVSPRGMVRVGSTKRYFKPDDPPLTALRDDSPLYQRLSQPLSLSFKGYLIFILNELKQIEKIKFVYTSC